MICIQFVSQDMDAEGKGVEQKSEKDCIVMCYMPLHLESQTTHPLRGLSPQTVIRLLTGEPVYESFRL